MRGGDRLRLAYPQLRLWRLDPVERGNPAYHVPFALRLVGPLRLDALRQAFSALVDRHAALRVTFSQPDEDAFQLVHEPAAVPFEVSSVPGADTDARLAAVRRQVGEEAARPFDLQAGPLLRVRVHRLDDEDHVVQWTVHHVVTDAWSLGVQVGDLGRAYLACASGGRPAWAPLPASYADFVAWQHEYVGSATYRADVGWWRERLHGLRPSLGLQADRPAAPGGFRAAHRNVRLPDDVGRGTLALAQWSGATLYMVALAAYAVVLAAEADADDVAVVSPIAGRLRSEWEPLAGFFVNRVVVRVHVDDAATFHQLLDGVRAACADAFGHQAVPFERLVAELDLPLPALTACFSVQNAPFGGGGFRGFRGGGAVDDDSGRAGAPIMELYGPERGRFQVSLVLRAQDEGIGGLLEYDAGLFEPERAARWHQRFQAVLARVASDPGTTVAQLRRLAGDGR